MKLSVSVAKTANMGDHAERMTTVKEYIEGETVEDLVKRCFPILSDDAGSLKYHYMDYTNKIVIKVIEPDLEDPL